MRYLITGGAGFIGSHLAEALLAGGDEVSIIDDLSTGSMKNIEHLKDHRKFRYSIDSIFNKPLLAELVDGSDCVIHLAAAVGVKLIVDSPVRTITLNVEGTGLVLDCAVKKRKKVLLASTSEVYGKSERFPFKESGDLVIGPPNKGRWSYACSKALDEFLAIAYHKEKDLPVVIVRLFNTVGPRQTGQYGMVVPNFIKQALRGHPITVFGSGRQTRCFVHVRDVVKALVALSREPRAVGQVFNLGSTQEVSILELARLVKKTAGSSSEIRRIPYDEAYEEGFEDMPRRVPDISKARQFVGFRPTMRMAGIIEDIIEHHRRGGQHQQESSMTTRKTTHRRGGRLGAALLAAALAAGCATVPDHGTQASPSGFPIGIYNVQEPEHLSILKENGFDTFLPAPRDAQGYERLARAARRLGMRMVPPPQPFLDKPAAATQGWPVLAWYLQDEPDVNRVTPEALAAFSKRVKDWDPRRLQTFVVGQGKSAAPYASTADAIMLDWYPVPHRPLESVAEQLELAARAVPKGKPIWMVLQAFDWAEDGSTKGKPVVTRFPTYDEIRFMTYASIMGGAKGLFYFRLSMPGGETLLDYPERWQALARVARELKLLKPVLEEGRQAPLPFPPNPDGPMARAWHHGGRTYVVLANFKKGSFLRVPEEMLKPQWRPLFSQRRDPRELLAEFGKARYLRPYQVLVLEGPATPDAARTW